MKRMITGRSGAWILVLCMAVLIGCSQRADGAGTAGTPVETGTAGAAGETDTPGAAEEAGMPGTTGIQGNEDTPPPMEETVNRFEILDVKESSMLVCGLDDNPVWLVTAHQNGHLADIGCVLNSQRML